MFYIFYKLIVVKWEAEYLLNVCLRALSAVSTITQFLPSVYAKSDYVAKSEKTYFGVVTLRKYETL